MLDEPVGRGARHVTLATGFHLRALAKEGRETSPLRVVSDLYMCALAYAPTHIIRMCAH